MEGDGGFVSGAGVGTSVDVVLAFARRDISSYCDWYIVSAKTRKDRSSYSPEVPAAVDHPPKHHVRLFEQIERRSNHLETSSCAHQIPPLNQVNLYWSTDSG